MSNNQTNSTNTPHRWAEVIKAWADGKTIQHSGIGSDSEYWTDWTWDSNHKFSPLHCLPNYKWRVKPEQKTGWINIYTHPEGSGYMDTSGSYVYPSKEEALNCVAGGLKYIACIQITYTEGEGL